MKSLEPCPRYVRSRPVRDQPISPLAYVAPLSWSSFRPLSLIWGVSQHAVPLLYLGVLRGDVSLCALLFLEGVLPLSDPTLSTTRSPACVNAMGMGVIDRITFSRLTKKDRASYLSKGKNIVTQCLFRNHPNWLASLSSPLYHCIYPSVHWPIVISLIINFFLCW